MAWGWGRPGGLPILSTFSSIVCTDNLPTQPCERQLKLSNRTNWRSRQILFYFVFAKYTPWTRLLQKMWKMQDAICRNLCFWKSTLCALAAATQCLKLNSRHQPFLPFLSNYWLPPNCWSRSALAAPIMMTHIGRYYGFDQAIWVFVGCTNIFCSHTVPINLDITLWMVWIWCGKYIFLHKLERTDCHWVSEENKIRKTKQVKVKLCSIQTQWAEKGLVPGGPPRAPSLFFLLLLLTTQWKYLIWCIITISVPVATVAWLQYAHLSKDK